MRVIGIDPGTMGAITLLDDEFESPRIVDLPFVFDKPGSAKKSINYRELIDCFKQVMPASFAVLEKVGPSSARGTYATCRLCASSSALKLLLILHKVEFIEVYPQTWKKHFSLVKKPKIDARILARSYYPDLELIRHDDLESVDRAESLLLALYAREYKRERLL